jgi:mannose-6-phosphate isomerase
MDAIVFNDPENYKKQLDPLINSRTSIVDCPYFTTDLIYIDRTVEKDFSFIDSFVIYMCVEGNCMIRSPDTDRVSLNFGQTVLIPAALKTLELMPEEKTKILEIYIK